MTRVIFESTEDLERYLAVRELEVRRKIADEIREAARYWSRTWRICFWKAADLVDPNPDPAHWPDGSRKRVPRDTVR